MKKYVAMLLALVVVVSCIGCGGGKNETTKSAETTKGEAGAENGETKATGSGMEEKDSYSVGICIQDLSNATWATQVNTIQEKCNEMGWSVTAVQHSNDAAKALTQVENFVESGCDFIILQTYEEDALKDTLLAAQKKGICIIGDGTELKCANMNYLNSNYDAGYYGGKALGNWANETFGEDHVLKIAQFQKNESVAVSQRTAGQIDGLKETHPNFELVAEGHPSDSTTAMNETESILTANPDIEAIFNWGDSMALGTLEAVRAMGYDEDKFMIVSVDGTQEALAEIKAGSALKMSCSLGGPVQQAETMVEMLLAYIDGTNEDTYYSPNVPIDISNVDEYLD